MLRQKSPEVLTSNTSEQDQINALAELLVNAYLRKPTRTKILSRAKTNNANTNITQVDFNTMLSLLSKVDFEETVERVAILEYDGGINRIDAEKIVLEKYLNQKIN